MFVTIVRCGSLQQASLKLRVSQPSLSKTVQVLEAAVGRPLLVRSRKGVTPTAEGKRLAQFGEALLGLTRAAEDGLASREPAALPAGELRVACHEVIAGFLWPAILRGTAAVAPELAPALYTETSARQLLQQVKGLDVDVAIGAELPTDAATVRTRIYTDRYGLFVGPGRRARQLSAAAWRAEPLLFLPQSIAGAGVSLGAALLQQGFAAPSRYAVHSYEAVISLAASGLGTAVLPRGPARFYVDHKLLAELTVKGGDGLGGHDIYALTRHGYGGGHAARFFVDHILPEAVRQLLA